MFELSGQIDKGLVAKYSFNNGNARDEAGSNDAKAYGILWDEDRFGNKDMACYLQGNFDSFLNLGTSDDLKPKCGSISLWIKLDQVVYKGEGADNNPIIYTRSHEGDDFNDAYVIAYHFNLRKLCCNTSFSETKQVHLFPTKTAYLRQWYHLVMTYDDQKISFYIDGKLEGKAAKNFSSKFLEGDSVLIGLHHGPKNKRYFQGYIDDINIYNKVLSGDEVMELYNAPNPNRTSIIIKWVAYGLGLISVVGLIIWIIRWRIAKALKKEKEENQLRNNWYDQENKVLAAQMDPHFIFNSLNTIQQFIIINDNEKAQLYLSRFSRLLRMILENNVKDNISLKDEIEIISRYLEIESIRFNNVFTYTIAVDDALTPESIAIPRFLIQPFVENAIWHGLLPKEGEKTLKITFRLENEACLCCIIDDNGVGMKYPHDGANLKRNHSLAINFIKQRLQLMSKLYKAEYSIEIIDRSAIGAESGTRIIAKIPILKNQ